MFRFQMLQMAIMAVLAAALLMRLRPAPEFRMSRVLAETATLLQ
jgi:hypothetical protein